jgi:hypothetical protein
VVDEGNNVKTPTHFLTITSFISFSFSQAAELPKLLSRHPHIAPVLRHRIGSCLPGQNPKPVMPGGEFPSCFDSCAKITQGNRI